ncbi:unnamed protein product [Brachionus calyciflorus]|uniref:Uncharacterized protein n=1 Tax=Brachionus calyciflorus TaxID=104777 RepID=A0A813MWK6_9BILA|nr:unnamed protein product [Brachionus calyciflorus]
MDELNDIFNSDYNTFYPNLDELDEKYVLSGDTPIKFLGNLKIWQLSGCFLAGCMFLILVILVTVKISKRISLNKNDLEDLEKLYDKTKTGKTLCQTNKKLFLITKQVCLLTHELKQAKKHFKNTANSEPREIVLIPEKKFIELDNDLVKNPDSFA